MKSHTLYLLVVIAFTPSLGQSQGTFDCHCAAVDEECFPSPTPCSSGCQSGWDGPFCQRQNVAYNKSASQSGVYVDTSDCVPDTPDVQTFCGAHGAQLAVDGNDDTDYWHGSCAVTDTSNKSAWWRLDLGATYNISSLQIYQSNHAPLVPPYIEVFVDGQECYNVTGSDISSTIINVMCHQTLSGSTLTLRTSPVDTAPSLTLCEVKIFRCSDFWFGSKCQYKCHCNDTLEVCDKTSGACASQCAAAWTGASCQDHNMALHQSAYQDGTWSDADNCSTSSTVYCGPRPATLAVDGSTDQNFRHGSCSQTALGRTITSWSLNLGSLHQIYRMKIYFPQKDIYPTTGLQVTVDGAVCYVTNTSLTDVANINCRQPLMGVFVSINLPPLPTSPGVTGSPTDRTLALCEVEIYECDDFWFGSNCSRLCRCQNTSEICDKMTGECPRSGCSAGWMGPGCQSACPRSTHGLNCSYSCGKCANNAVCDHVTGACPGSCAAGFAAKDCSECLTGLYGINCDQSCPSCPGNGSCDRNNGTCSTPCPAHHTGTNCDRCHDDWYGSKCQFHCGECRNDGPCNKTTGRCPNGCDPGWQGALCQQECADGRFGMDCSQVCGHCVDPAPCDKLTGICLDECAPGWVGDLCDNCLTGLYGINCDQSCPSCPGNGSCDRNNGTCSTPCPAHHAGTNCDRCHDDWYGSKCQFHCGECRNDGPCNKTTGRCPNGCDPGWQGALCQQECADGRFGMDCSQVCGHCVDPAPCDKLTGICLDECAPGWVGDLCDKCLTGLYGINCDQSCPSCPGNGSCDRNNGTCSTPCPAHHAGTNCDRCHDDWYGSKCQFECGECRNDGPCNKTTGRCPNGCDSGWQGALCQQECADGRFGMDCSQVCGHCVDPAPCDKLTGICLDECAPGWGGDLCDSCAAGFYSLHCNETCGHCVDDTCDALTGQCDAGCEPGWTGYDCVTRKRPTPTPTSSTSSTSSSATSTTPTTPPHTTKVRQHNQTPHGHRTTSHGNTQHGTEQPSTQGLSEGTLAGIIVSCVLVLCIVLHSFIFLRYSRRRSCHWLRARRKHTYGRDRVESPEDYTSGTELPKYATASTPGTEEDRVTAGIINPNYDQSLK